MTGNDCIHYKMTSFRLWNDRNSTSTSYKCVTQWIDSSIQWQDFDTSLDMTGHYPPGHEVTTCIQSPGFDHDMPYIDQTLTWHMDWSWLYTDMMWLYTDMIWLYKDLIWLQTDMIWLYNDLIWLYTDIIIWTIKRHDFDCTVPWPDWLYTVAQFRL